MSVLLGIDVPELTKLLQGEVNKAESVFAVVTRAGEKRKKAEEEENERKEAASGVKPNTLSEPSTDKAGSVNLVRAYSQGGEKGKRSPGKRRDWKKKDHIYKL